MTPRLDDAFWEEILRYPPVAQEEFVRTLLTIRALPCARERSRGTV